KGRDFQAKVNELDRDVQAKRQALERSNADALQKIQEVMVKIITDIAKDRKANLVFQRSELVRFDQGFDVTDQVLQKLDEQMPTLDVTFVAPVAANAPDQGTPPATTPGPAPAPTPAKPAPPPKKK
ncbi:MAG TPA: OmpH family outer membrane protein, partial [Stellaceae bacterium]|nr:OmpH family outer membrane protein [Stellaceae bacterium]